ncbi:MAG: type II secretion system protein [Candidatus Hydrogenedentota bacterium]|nr:MAG: type II secretion system protein [Candidatus Hydrogenedentota bacterium]
MPSHRPRRKIGGQRVRVARGFTLIELLVVVTIIGILAAVMLTNIRHALRKAKEGRTFAGLNTLRTAIYMNYSLVNKDQNFGGNPTGGWPWTLKEGNWFTPPAGSENWAAGDGMSGGQDEGQNFHVSAEMSQFLSVIPLAEVADQGNWTWADGAKVPSNGVWQSNLLPPSGNPVGNFRGWHYRNTDGKLRINNNSLSTEGKRYDEY